MSAPNPPLSEADLIVAVAELADVADDIRFMRRGELADRLDAIIANRFGYVVERIREEKASA